MQTSRLILFLCFLWLLPSLTLLADTPEQARARNEEEALTTWPEIADTGSLMSKEVQRLLNFYTERQDPRLSSITSPMWIASQAATNIESQRTAAESQQSAMRLYPSLAVLDTPLNKLFRETFTRYKQVEPRYFDDPRWPIKLARQCAVQLDAQSAVDGSKLSRSGPSALAQQTLPVIAQPASSPFRIWIMPSILLVVGALLTFLILHHARRMHHFGGDERDGSSI